MKAALKTGSKEMSILIFYDNGWWIAQCLEYDIAAQARTINDVQYEIQRLLIGRIFAGRKLKVEPFENIPPAPEEYHKIVKETNKTLRVELRPIKNSPIKIPPAFMLPKEALLVA